MIAPWYDFGCLSSIEGSSFSRVLMVLIVARTRAANGFYSSASRSIALSSSCVHDAFHGTPTIYQSTLACASLLGARPSELRSLLAVLRTKLGVIASPLARGD